MTTTEQLTEDALAAALRAQAAGHLTAEAAVELLIEQEVWLARSGFRRFVDYEADPEITGGQPMAGIRWADAIAALDSGELRGSSTAERILRIAASFGAGVPVNLRETMTNSLGRAHAQDVIRAVTHAVRG